MDIKQMRKALRKAGVDEPGKNADVMPAYYEMLKKNEPVPDNETVEGPVKEEFSDPASNVIEDTIEVAGSSPVIELVSTNLWTYVGSGDEPPYMINFMGMQKFVRGQATKVRPEVVEKIKNHICFVKGSVDMDAMFKNDEKEKELVNKKREVDIQIQARIDRVNKS